MLNETFSVIFKHFGTLLQKMEIEMQLKTRSEIKVAEN